MTGRILYICNDGFYFGTHRAHLAQRVRAEGWDVLVATGGDARAVPAPLRTLSLDIERLRISPARDLAATRDIMAAIDKFEPDVVHLITMKPILLTATGVLWNTGATRLPKFVVTFPGLGRAFEGTGAAGAAMRRIATTLLGRFFTAAPATATFENAEDLRTLVELRVVAPDRAKLLAGTGLDLEAFSPPRTHRPAGPFRALWASRLIKGKGIHAFVDAARLARAWGAAAEFLVAGYPDPGHPDCLAPAEMAALAQEPAVHFLGHVTDMPDLLRSVDTLVLPSSYNEGLPRILIEAAACGLPLVASDSPGCRVLIREGETGLLLSSPSPTAILDAVLKLAADPEMARRIGQAARQEVLSQGSDNRSIQDAFIALYAER